MELEQSIPVGRIKRSVRGCVWALEFDVKRLNKGEGRIGRNVVSITMKMKTIVRIFEVIKMIKLHLRNFDK